MLVGGEGANRPGVSLCIKGHNGVNPRGVLPYMALTGTCSPVGFCGLNWGHRFNQFLF